MIAIIGTTDEVRALVAALQPSTATPFQESAADRDAYALRAAHEDIEAQRRTIERMEREAAAEQQTVARLRHDLALVNLAVALAQAPEAATLAGRVTALAAERDKARTDLAAAIARAEKAEVERDARATDDHDTMLVLAKQRDAHRAAAEAAEIERDAGRAAIALLSGWLDGAGAPSGGGLVDRADALAVRLRHGAASREPDVRRVRRPRGGPELP